jgi:hypothetical protein
MPVEISIRPGVLSDTAVFSKGAANPGIGYGGVSFAEPAKSAEEHQEEIPEEEMINGYMHEAGAEVKNTGIAPGEHPDIEPGADADAASG